MKYHGVMPRIEFTLEYLPKTDRWRAVGTIEATSTTKKIKRSVITRHEAAAFKSLMLKLAKVYGAI